jgi:hypothetical protein
MNIFSIDLSINEITFLRQALEPISIQGRDAKFVASLQLKLEHELEEIQKILQEEEQKKIDNLQELFPEENNKSFKKK